MNQHESVLLIKEPVQTSLGQNNLQKNFFFFFFPLTWPVKFRLLAWDHWRQARRLSSFFLSIGLVLYNCQKASQARGFLFHKRESAHAPGRPQERAVSLPAPVARLSLLQSLCLWRQSHLVFGTHVRILDREEVGAQTEPWRARLSPQFVSTVWN